MTTRLRDLLFAAVCAAAVLSGFPLGCDSGKKSDGRGGSPAARKQGTRHYAIMSGGRKVGYGLASLRIADGKTVSELEGHFPWPGNAPEGMQWDRKFTTRHVETLDGRPLIFQREHVSPDGKVRKVTFTVDADGKARVTRGDEPGANAEAEDWPEGALLWHGQHLLMRREGLAEGTTYTFKEFIGEGGLVQHVRVRVGGRATVDLLGREMELTEVTYVYENPSQPGPVGKIVLHVDDDLAAHRIRVDFGSNDLTWIACSKAEAMRPPGTSPTDRSAGRNPPATQPATQPAPRRPSRR